jgi:hypothetical protein
LGTQRWWTWCNACVCSVHVIHGPWSCVKAHSSIIQGGQGSLIAPSHRPLHTHQCPCPLVPLSFLERWQLTLNGGVGSVAIKTEEGWQKPLSWIFFFLNIFYGSSPISRRAEIKHLHSISAKHLRRDEDLHITFHICPLWPGCVYHSKVKIRVRLTPVRGGSPGAGESSHHSRCVWLVCSSRFDPGILSSWAYQALIW